MGAARDGAPRRARARAPARDRGGSIAPVSQASVLRCPACDAVYLLPKGLLGAFGARVTCPACRRAFEVDASGARVADPPRARPPAASPPDGPSPGSGERAVAVRVLDELAGRLGPELAEAAGSGRLFRAHGADLARAFDAYRRRAGAGAGAQAFRDEVRRRWRVDLRPSSDPPGPAESWARTREEPARD